MHTLAKESTHAMEIQSHLCQLKVEDLGVIAKTLGCGDSDIKDKTRKGLVRLIEKHLEAKLKGSVEPDTEFLEDFRTGITIYTPWCPPLEDVSKKKEVGSLSIGTRKGEVGI